MSEERKYSEEPRNKKRKNSKAARRRKKKIAVIVISVIVIIILAAILFVFGKLGKIRRLNFNEENINVNEGLEDKNGYITVALYGGDSRNAGTVGKGTHSDCIIIACINNKTKDVKLVSIYRDTLVDICDPDELSYLKCTQAYFLGGPEQAVNTLNKNFDLAIKDYVTVDFTAIATAIDLLGGIDIELTEEEAEWTNKYAWDTSANTGMDYTPIPYEAGYHHLDGIMATSYARIRATAGDDLKRAERQRTVIQLAIEKAKKADLFTLNNIIDTVLPMCATSFSNSEILSLVKDITSYNIKEQTGYPFELSTKMLGAKGDCVIPLGHVYNVTKLHEFLYDETDYKPSKAVQKINDDIEAETGFKAPEPSSEEKTSSSATVE